RVWFGSDYVVLTYNNESSGKLHVKIQSWNGQWVSQDTVIGKKASADSLLVHTSQHTIALSFRNKDTGNDELYLFRNDNRGGDQPFGKWVLYNNQPFILTLQSQSKVRSLFIAGDDFVVAYNKDYLASKV